jgi:hypothetical protein
MFLGKLDQDSGAFIDAVIAEHERDGVDVGDTSSLPVTGGGHQPITCTQVIEKSNFVIIEFTYDDDVNNVVHFKFVNGKLNAVTVREHTLNGQRTKSLLNGTAGPREPVRNIRF